MLQPRSPNTRNGCEASAKQCSFLNALLSERLKMRGWPIWLFKAPTKPHFTIQGHFWFLICGLSRSGDQSIVIDGILIYGIPTLMMHLLAAASLT